MALLAILSLVTAACTTDDSGPTTSGPEAPTSSTSLAATTTIDSGDLGSATNPVEVVLLPGDDATSRSADLLESFLEDETGYAFEVTIGETTGEVIEVLCAGQAGVAAVLPAEGYVVGNDRCGIRPRLKAIKDGYTNYWAEFLVPRNSKFETLDDLAGKSWAHTEPPSASGWLVPSGMLAANDVEPGHTTAVRSHRRAVLAVYNGTVAFGTTWYLPPIDAAGNDLWDGTVGNADVPDDLIASCAGSQGGDLFCGGNYEVRDARRTIAGEHPDVVQKLRILTLSDPIPNDTLAFSPDFPNEIQEAIVQVLRDLSQGNPRRFARLFAAYSWSGVAETNDAEFESARRFVNTLGLSQEDLS